MGSGLERSSGHPANGATTNRQLYPTTPGAYQALTSRPQRRPGVKCGCLSLFGCEMKRFMRA